MPKRYKGREARCAKKMLTFTLAVKDPELIREIESRPEGERGEFLLAALRVGVVALRAAGGALDADKIRAECALMLESVSARLAEHSRAVSGQVERILSAYFDPGNGLFQQRISKLLDRNGEVERMLREYLSSDDSVLAKTMARQIGAESPLFRLLSPDERNGLLATIEGLIKDELSGQREKVLAQFSLDNPGSALTRLVEKISSVNGDFGNSIKSNLKAALQEMSFGIKEALTEITRSHAELRADLLSAVSRIEVKRAEAMRTTVHGATFESALSGLLQRIAHGAGDLFERVGSVVGAIKNCKKGDFVLELGPDSLAPGSRIVFEAKEDQSYRINDALREIEEARKNRSAQFGVFVFSAKSAPNGIAPFQRFGQHLVLVWDADDPSTDVRVEAAYSVGKALCVRQQTENRNQARSLETIESAVRSIEKQIAYLEAFRQQGETIK